MCKVKIRLHAKLMAIGCNNYLCLNSILQNGHEHNSPQSQVQLKATYEFFLNALFVSLRQPGCTQFHNFVPNAGNDLSSTLSINQLQFPRKKKNSQVIKERTD